MCARYGIVPDIVLRETVRPVWRVAAVTVGSASLQAERAIERKHMNSVGLGTFPSCTYGFSCIPFAVAPHYGRREIVRGLQPDEFGIDAI